MLAPSRPLSERRRAFPKKAAIAAAVAVLTLVTGFLVAAPIVRSRVIQEGARRRLDVTVGGVRPGFFSVALHDVQVRPQGVEGISVRLEDVHVDLSAGLSVREITGRGGEIRLDGEPEDLAERLRDFRKKEPTEAPSAKGHRTPLSAEGLTLDWKLPSGGSVNANGIKLSRGDDALRAGFEKLTASYRQTSVTVAAADVELGGDGVLKRVTAASVAVAHEGPALRSAARAPATGGPAGPAPPPLPTLATKGRGRVIAAKSGKAAPAPAPPAPEGPLLPLPDLHALRARIAGVASTFGARVPEGSKVDIGGLSVRLDAGGDPFAFGPGPFSLERRGDRVHVAFASDKAAGGTPLAIDAELPLGAGDVTARLSGGPVSLALLGVKEGQKGLADVNKGTVSGKGQIVLAAGGESMTFDGQLALRSISIKQPRLSNELLRGLDFSVSARGLLEDGGRLRIDDAQLDMGALHVHMHGTIEETQDHLALALAADVAPASCQALLDSAPQGLLPTLRAARMSGTFGATSRIEFDTRAIDKLTLEYKVDDQCRMVEVPRELSRDRFSSSFTYRTYHPDGTPSETTTGPGTTAWTDLDGISPFMVAALLTTEDGAFYKHKGFNHAAIRSSVAANLKARRFVRGASTITMQLAKNLFLSREKTLSRKIEEVVLTDYLEQAFRKDDMMELYLNVVEFGPDVYGVTRAAEHYFGRKPEELNLPECFFLASLLPSPVRYGRLRDKGEVSEGWMRHLSALMEISAKNGKITKAELAEGLSQSIVFHKAGDPAPEPRKPVSSGRRDPFEDDSGWRPLE